MHLILRWMGSSRMRRWACCALGLSMLGWSARTMAQAASDPATPAPQATPSVTDAQSTDGQADDATEATPARIDPPKPAAEGETAPKAKEPAAPEGAIRRSATPARARGTKDLPPDPNAKWVCEQLTASAEPVWRGSGKSVDFEFTIKNAGTADLQIRAKGG